MLAIDAAVCDKWYMSFDQYRTRAGVEARLLERNEELRIIRGMPRAERHYYKGQVKATIARIAALAEQLAVMDAKPDDEASLEKVRAWLSRCATRVTEGYYDQPAVDHLFDISDCIAPEVRELLPDAFTAFDDAVAGFNATDEISASVEPAMPDMSVSQELNTISLAEAKTAPVMGDEDNIKRCVLALFVNDKSMHIGEIVRAIWGHELQSDEFLKFRSILHSLAGIGELYNWRHSRYARVPEPDWSKRFNDADGNSSMAKLPLNHDLEKKLARAGLGTPMRARQGSTLNNKTDNRGGQRRHHTRSR